MPILAALRLDDPNDHLCAIDVIRLKSNDLACTQTTAIAEGEHDVGLEFARHGEQPLGLFPAHGEGQLLRLFEVVDLGCEIVPPQRDAEQEPHSGHDPVTIADAVTSFDQVQLEAANIVGGGRVGEA
jgi:hypothetical protein